MTEAKTTEKPKTSNKSSMAWKDIVSVVTAAVALFGFAWFIIYLVGQTGSAEETEWNRLVYLLSGVEAIAFSAAGFVFGVEVNRKRAETAEEDRDQAKTQVQTAQTEAVQANAEKNGLLKNVEMWMEEQDEESGLEMMGAHGQSKMNRLRKILDNYGK